MFKPMTDLRTSRWIAYRRWIHITLLGSVVAWWALWDFQRGSLIPSSALSLKWIDSALVKPILFWGLPVGGIAVVEVICYSLDKVFLGRRWTVSDILRRFRF
jgi:O-antigen/teichoic acid export membrane protein